VAQSSGTGGGSPRRPQPSPQSTAEAPVDTANRAESPDRQRFVLPLAAFVLLVVAVVSTVYALVALPKHGTKHHSAPVAHGGSTAATTSTTSASTAGDTSATPSTVPGVDPTLIAWMRTALPTDAPIVATKPVATALRNAGFTAVAAQARPGKTAGRASGTYWLVSTTARSGGVAVPVARFGSASTDVSVGLMLANATTARRDAAVASDRSNRLTADRALAKNAAVHADSQVRSMLRQGKLDARPATMLALLAGSVPVQVRSLPINPAESAVGRPARTVVVDTSVDALALVRDMLPVKYRPASMVSTGSSTTLVWNVAVDPVRTVS
jgi:hypothetical protein